MKNGETFWKNKRQIGSPVKMYEERVRGFVPAAAATTQNGVAPSKPRSAINGRPPDGTVTPQLATSRRHESRLAVATPAADAGGPSVTVACPVGYRRRRRSRSRFTSLAHAHAALRNCSQFSPLLIPIDRIYL